MKKIIAIIGVLMLILIGIQVFDPIANVTQDTTVTHQSAVPTQAKTPTFSYKGQNGVDALTLLKKKIAVEQDTSGLVVSIGGDKPTGHTYWAFYVNGKYSNVGPAQYVTKNSDTILWKVEK